MGPWIEDEDLGKGVKPRVKTKSRCLVYKLFALVKYGPRWFHFSILLVPRTSTRRCPRTSNSKCILSKFQSRLSLRKGLVKVEELYRRPIRSITNCGMSIDIQISPRLQRKTRIEWSLQLRNIPLTGFALLIVLRPRNVPRTCALGKLTMQRKTSGTFWFANLVTQSD